MRLFLRSDFTTKYLQSRQPTFVPAAEAVEEIIPFLARNFLRWHNYPPLSNSSRECLWRFTSLPQRVTFERLRRFPDYICYQTVLCYGHDSPAYGACANFRFSVSEAFAASALARS